MRNKKQGYINKPKMLIQEFIECLPLIFTMATIFGVIVIAVN